MDEVKQWLAESQATLKDKITDPSQRNADYFSALGFDRLSGLFNSYVKVANSIATNLKQIQDKLDFLEKNSKNG